jgi:hypothetical protein
MIFNATLLWILHKIIMGHLSLAKGDLQGLLVIICMFIVQLFYKAHNMVITLSYLLLELRKGLQVDLVCFEMIVSSTISITN